MDAGLKLIIRKLNQLIDESGSDNLENRYCLLTLMLHEQAIDISESIHHHQRKVLRLIVSIQEGHPQGSTSKKI